jgi:hypothetical protein
MCLGMLGSTTDEVNCDGAGTLTDLKRFVDAEVRDAVLTRPTCPHMPAGKTIDGFCSTNLSPTLTALGTTLAVITETLLLLTDAIALTVGIATFGASHERFCGLIFAILLCTAG